MSTITKSIKHHPESPPLSDGLLIQFILVHYIESYAEFQIIEQKCHRKNDSVSKEEWVKAKHPLNYVAIEDHLTKLTGSYREQIKTVSWSFSEGILYSIKKHCAILLQNIEVNPEDYVALHHYAEKVLQASIATLDVMREPPLDSLKFITALDKTLSSLRSFGKQLMRIISNFNENENLLFCILCYKESLDKIFGKGYVSKLLTKNTGLNLAQIAQLIAEKYSKRGFQHLIPAINAKIGELEAEKV